MLKQIVIFLFVNLWIGVLSQLRIEATNHEDGTIVWTTEDRGVVRSYRGPSDQGTNYR